LARHFAMAGEHDKAIEYYRRAAQRAIDRYAYEEAIHHLRTALDLLEVREQTELRLTLLEELADAHNLLGQGVQAIPLYQEALSSGALWLAQTNGAPCACSARPVELTLRYLHSPTASVFEACAEPASRPG